VGRIKTVFHRAIPADAKIKQVVIKRESQQHWYATFALELPDPEPLPRTGAVVGVDVGLNALVATSDGELVDAPRYYRRVGYNSV